METRIKFIKKNSAGYYAVQVKKWIFWKTIYTDTIFANVEEFIDTLAQIVKFNNKTKSSDKIVYEGWAVRNVYESSYPAYSINFFKSQPSKRKRNNDSGIYWADSDGKMLSIMDINTKTLFGKECLEPMKLRITIEQIEE